MTSTVLEFPADEPKVSVKWTKGTDFMDGTPRYTFEGRDPQDTYERFQVVIYTEREQQYPHDPRSVRNAYYGYVRDTEKECADTIGPFWRVKEAKEKTLELFNQFMENHLMEQSAPNDSHAMEWGQMM